MEVDIKVATHGLVEAAAPGVFVACFSYVAGNSDSGCCILAKTQTFTGIDGYAHSCAWLREMKRDYFGES